ncbi:hypothetical protein LB577_06940 [Mesorhizobium sp. B283B1A]|uniref:hypothetical protein n=1 Tax=Mesorhizobium TaxID=68287 RepID=UPI001CD088E4|nr:MULTISPECIES: hypothetical protein [Mesorhizobium]MCA0046691.1 hypothetical protein [Mesorhizobium sp. B283B1A]UQS61948.1 hypothetical protein M5D98_17290 [Mesorhizobium opportunistum]
MSPEPLGRRPNDLGALTPERRDILYTDIVRRAHQERSEAIRLSAVWIASILKRRLTGIIVSTTTFVGAAVARVLGAN